LASNISDDDDDEEEEEEEEREVINVFSAAAEQLNQKTLNLCHHPVAMVYVSCEFLPASDVKFPFSITIF